MIEGPQRLAFMCFYFRISGLGFRVWGLCRAGEKGMGEGKERREGERDGGVGKGNKGGKKVRGKALGFVNLNDQVQCRGFSVQRLVFGERSSFHNLWAKNENAGD